MEVTTNILRSRILKTADVAWKALKFIQQDDFKSLADEEKSALKTSILSNAFVQPFYVWQDPDEVIWCLDGRHRVLCQLELETMDGVQIPESLPAVFIDCTDKKEAAKLTLIYSSLYAKVQYKGLYDFMQLYELEYDSLKEQISLPELSMERFEQKFNLYQIGNDEEELMSPANISILVQPGDLFQLNGHRIICGSFKDDAIVSALMQGEKARIVNCDPPYNIPVGLFLKETKHDDFEMAAGEMSDEEFVMFLSLIMQRSVDNTLPGAIHYMFMDFRHVWHITEAGRRVYGKAQPKQLCVWNKDLMANGSFYRAQHELCFLFSNDQAKALWNNDLLDEGGFYKNENELCFIFKNGESAKHLSHLELKDRIRTNIWRYPSAISIANPDRHQIKNHPTPKPVSMIADAILDTTNEGDIVIDWFLGSGTCLIGCEKTDRRCYATEIEPKYIQSDIQRYISYCSANGKPVTFEHLNGNLTLNDFINVKAN